MPTRHNPQAINTGGHQPVSWPSSFHSNRLPSLSLPPLHWANFFAAFLRLNTGKTCTQLWLALARWFRAEWAKLLISIQPRQAEEKMAHLGVVYYRIFENCERLSKSFCRCKVNPLQLETFFTRSIIEMISTLIYKDT